jgi:predicted dithiol-disulfide oxidoreductase (DUF899 family)
MHETRFPHESPEYRAAREKLLAAEMELRRKVSEVAALRRTLPLGGVVPEDYTFDSTRGPLRLSELFGDQSTLAIYSMMYGPEMDAACPSCTSIVDALDAQVHHIEQRVPLVVIAKNPLDKILAHAETRGWRRIRMLSSAGNSYNRDYHAETSGGSQIPAMNVFVKRDGRIHHFWAAELLYVDIPGEDPRHVDTIWPLWNVLDLTPEGRGDFYPALTY